MFEHCFNETSKNKALTKSKQQKQQVGALFKVGNDWQNATKQPDMLWDHSVFTVVKLTTLHWL